MSHITTTACTPPYIYIGQEVTLLVGGRNFGADILWSPPWHGKKKKQKWPVLVHDVVLWWLASGCCSHFTISYEDRHRRAKRRQPEAKTTKAAHLRPSHKLCFVAGPLLTISVGWVIEFFIFSFLDGQCSDVRVRSKWLIFSGKQEWGGWIDVHLYSSAHKAQDHTTAYKAIML